VNTGHLGFFQELDAEDLDVFIEAYGRGDYVEQRFKTVYADVVLADGSTTHLKGLNDIAVVASGSGLAHLDIYIGDSFIEKFAGDGLVISTPAGSTAYNYALGGDIVDPRLDLLQVTPIAPISSNAYRSFTSGILLPPDLSFAIFPAEADRTGKLLVAADGRDHVFDGVKEIRCGYGEHEVRLLRFGDYDFWNTAKRKLL
jgi:NAD+ kinase